MLVFNTFSICNEAQGQIILYMGLYLPNPVFAHGQLYVALSRVQSKNKIKILVKNRYTNNNNGEVILYIKKFFNIYILCYLIIKIKILLI